MPSKLWPKWYVVSGDLRDVIIARTSLHACYRALSRTKDSIVVDPAYFYVDERGFRTNGNDGRNAAMNWHRTADVMDYCENTLGWEDDQA